MGTLQFPMLHDPLLKTWPVAGDKYDFVTLVLDDCITIAWALATL